MSFTKVTSAGIGSTELVTLDSLEVINNASIGGVLTYEDVTNVDSIGIITARAGVLVGSGITLSKDGDIFATGITTVSGNVKVGTGITLSPDGDVFFTGIATGNGSGLTALNASNISSGTVPTARLGSGTASSSTFLRGDSTFAAVTSTTINNNADNRLITGSGTANTLEGEANLTYDGTTLNIIDSTSGSGSHRLTIGNSHDLRLYHDGNSNIGHYGAGNFYLTSNSGTDLYVRSADDLFLQPQDGEDGIKVIGNGSVELYYDNARKFRTVSDGVEVNSAEAGEACLALIADEGDDNADYWRIKASTSSDFYLQNYASGSWETSIDATGNGNVRLMYDNSKKIETTSTGVTITNDLLLDGSANLGNYIRTNYDGGGHMYFRNNSQGANYSSHFQTYLSSDEAGTAQTHIHYYHGGYCELLHQGDSVIRTLADGVQFRDGGAVKGQFTDEGLCFGTDTAAANALDDYEEGTWTPLIRNSSGTGTPGGSNYGYYSKIGNIVHAHATVQWTALSGGTTSTLVVIVGLPFTSKNSTNYRSTSLLGGQVVGVHNGNDDGMNIAIGCDANMSSVYVTAVNGSSTSGYNYTHYPTVLSTGTIFGFSFTYLAQ